MHILNQNTFKMLIEQNWLNMRPGLGRSKLIEGRIFILKMRWQSVLLGFVWKFLPSLFLSKVCDGLIDRFDQSLPCRKQFWKDFLPIISMINLWYKCQEWKMERYKKSFPVQSLRYFWIIPVANIPLFTAKNSVQNYENAKWYLFHWLISDMWVS